jgi:hypothetical protein
MGVWRGIKKAGVPKRKKRAYKEKNVLISDNASAETCTITNFKKSIC